MIRSYTITGMSCESCARRISAALSTIAGVDAATVTLHPPVARLDLTAPVSADRLQDTIAGLGAYRLTEAGDDDSEATSATEPATPPPDSLYPLFLIIGYIAVTVGLVAIVAGDTSLTFLMNNFMAGFFLVFSFFKLLDRRGFSDAYRSYDILAQTLPGWGSAYPFIELALGVAYLLHASPVVLNITTLALMLIGSAGVLRALLAKRRILCACLGTALKLPMTTVTLVEDLGMAAMAAAMLLTVMR